MKTKVEKSILQKKLTNILGVVEENIFDGHFLASANKGKSSITATDLETSYREIIEMDVIEEGGVCIPAKKFLDLIKEMEGLITIEKDKNNWITAKAGKSSFKLAGRPAEEFPALPEMEGELTISIPSEILKKQIEKTLYAVSASDSRYSIGNLLFRIQQNGDFGNLILVGTDSHRLAMTKKPVLISQPIESDVLLSRKSISELKKVLPDSVEMIHITISGNHVLFKIDESEYFTRRVEGTYPDYTKIIPDSFSIIATVDRLAFLKSLKLVSAMSSKEKSYTVKLFFKENSLTIRAEDPDYGEAEDELGAEYMGEPFTISFNAKYLIEAISPLTTETVELKFAGKEKPLQIEHQDYMTLIMPLKGV